MFGFLMPPGQDDKIEDHYEDINCWRSEKISAVCLPELLQEMMNIQYTPSKELAMIYFANNSIETIGLTTIRDKEAIEMVANYGDKLKLAFLKACADKLMLASRNMRLRAPECQFICTPQLKQVVQSSYTSMNPRELEYNTKTLWFEYQIAMDKLLYDQTPKDEWYMHHSRDPRTDHVVEITVKPHEITRQLLGIENALRQPHNTSNPLFLKYINMHLLMMSLSMNDRFNWNDGVTQHMYNDIKEYVLSENISFWGIWDNAEDLDPAQVIMVSDLSRAVRSAVKLEGATTKAGLQKLMQWFAIETYVVAKTTKDLHPEDSHEVRAIG